MLLPPGHQKSQETETYVWKVAPSAVLEDEGFYVGFRQHSSLAGLSGTIGLKGEKLLFSSAVFVHGEHFTEKLAVILRFGLGQPLDLGS